MSGACAGIFSSGKTLTVMSFIIRDENKTDHGTWDERKGGIATIIQSENPDIIGFQEVTQHVFDDLSDIFADTYESYGQLRDESDGSEMTPIFVRKEAFEVADKGSFWLSETPDVAYSKSWDAKYARVVSWMKLTSKESGKPVAVVLNTHFDHKGFTAQTESGTLIGTRAKELSVSFGAPIIVTGDFNSYLVYFSMQNLWNSGDYSDSYHSMSKSDQENSITAHDYEGETAEEPIDYISVTKPLTITKSWINRDQYNGDYPSDHFPVVVTVSGATK